MAIISACAICQQADGQFFYEPGLQKYGPSNINLRECATPEYLVVSGPGMMEYAIQVSGLHPDLSTMVVDARDIYREFGDGTLSAQAIRDFAKHLYNQQPGKLRYLLLFGDGSSENLIQSPNNTNILPTYHIQQSENQTIATDDYFGILSDDNNSLSIGVGRLPAKNANDAQILVNKLKSYITANSDKHWKKNLIFLADDGNQNLHMEQADRLAEKIEKRHPEYNIRKIYTDQYPQQATAAGNTYPAAKRDLLDCINNGALLLDFVGHGGMKFFTDERILTISDIDAMRNQDRLPVMITASCEIGRFDYYDKSADIATDSPAERLMLNPNGGAIALLTATRTAQSDRNFALNNNILDYILEPETDGHKNRLGDIMRLSKLATNDKNMLSFTLIGDPALYLDYPELEIEIESINGLSFKDFDEPLKALGTYDLKCRIINGENLDGTAHFTLWDKKSSRKTLGNDGEKPFVYSEYQTKIIEGQATVSKGAFSFKVLIPKDIDNNLGPGKLSLFAQCGETLASGFSKDILIGGTFGDALPDYDGPDIELTLSEPGFVDGGTILNRRPTLIATLSDKSGINTAGIGHAITVEVDNKYPFVSITEKYQTERDSYTRGQLTHQLDELADGHHTVTLKAWDNYNNCGEAKVDFVIINGDKLLIPKLINYPNPFSGQTNFVFEHNNPDGMLEYEISILSVSGRLVKTIKGNVADGKSISEPIEWDGMDNSGNRIAPGIYIYNLIIKNLDNQKAQKSGKMLYLGER